MMAITFRPATRENVGLIIGLSGPSGGGKTRSAMRLAAGIVGPGKPFAVIDTESRRALHYADDFRFDHAELGPPFRPDRYAEAIAIAEKAGYGAIVVDSFSHSWAGEGGVLDWQEEELKRMAGDDWAKRERVKMAAWIKPKIAHKAMMQKLLQVRAHLILCFRAEEKVEIVRGPDGKQQIVPKGYQPICDKMVPFELTASFLLTPDAPGCPRPIKLQEQHRAAFPADKPISEDTGRSLAIWAKGGAEGIVASPVKDDPRQPADDPAPAYAPKMNEIEHDYLEAQSLDALAAAAGRSQAHREAMPDEARKTLALVYQRRKDELAARAKPKGD